MVIPHHLTAVIPWFEAASNLTSTTLILPNPMPGVYPESRDFCCVFLFFFLSERQNTQGLYLLKSQSQFRNLTGKSCSCWIGCENTWYDELIDYDYWFLWAQFLDGTKLIPFHHSCKNHQSLVGFPMCMHWDFPTPDLKKLHEFPGMLNWMCSKIGFNGLVTTQPLASLNNHWLPLKPLGAP